jgi:prepilin-type N-terminal cleavage/methylation domain-containing protein
MHFRIRRTAFSLVELLVALAIIAALLAFFLPTLAKARRVSRSVACKARLEQLGCAIHMYLNENHTHYPQAPSLPSVNPNGYPTIQQCLSHYISDTNEAFQCPADEIVYPVEGISYFYYSELGEIPLAQTFFWQIFGNPSQVPALWDATVPLLTTTGSSSTATWRIISCSRRGARNEKAKPIYKMAIKVVSLDPPPLQLADHFSWRRWMGSVVVDPLPARSEREAGTAGRLRCVHGQRRL